MAPRDNFVTDVAREPATMSDVCRQEIWIECLLGSTLTDTKVKVRLMALTRVGKGTPFDRLERALNDVSLWERLAVPPCARAEGETLADALRHSVDLWKIQRDSGRNFLRDYTFEELKGLFPRAGAVTAAEYLAKTNPGSFEIPPTELIKEFAEFDLGIAPAPQYQQWRLQMLPVFQAWQALEARSSPGGTRPIMAEWLDRVAEYRSVARVITGTANIIGFNLEHPITRPLPSRSELAAVKIPKGLSLQLTPSTMEYLRDYFGYAIDPLGRVPKEGTAAYKEAVTLFVFANDDLKRKNTSRAIRALQDKVKLHYSMLGSLSKKRTDLHLEPSTPQANLNLPAALMPRGNLSPIPA